MKTVRRFRITYKRARVRGASSIQVIVSWPLPCPLDPQVCEKRPETGAELGVLVVSS